MILAERYQIIRPLAQGGFGKTYLACDRYLPGHPECVIKQLCLPHASADTLKTAHRLFDLEAKTLYKLGSHQQIPTLLAHFEHSGEFYLVQAYIPGQSLQDEFASNWENISAHRVTYTHALLQDLLGVLAFVHQQNVIHRDIKPANLIRCTTDHQIVLIDFGAVKASTTALVNPPPLTVAIGSPGYMAPEQQAGRPCFASDLYSVGMVGLEALTGLAPQQIPVNAKTGQFDLKALSGSLPNDAFSDDALSNEAFDGRPLLDFLLRLTRLSVSDRPLDASVALAMLTTLAGEYSESPSRKAVLGQGVLQKPGLRTTLSTAPENALPDETAFPETVLPTASSQPLKETVKNTFAPLSPAEARNRQALISKVSRFWIQGVLDHSLHGQVLLTLGLEERSAALALPWNITVKESAAPAQPLDSGTRVFDVFEQLGEGRSLLILGEPGAGKTTTLLTLTRDLLERYQQNSHTSRIPAIFNLSSWTGGPIDRWLITELNSKYQIPKTIGEAWVNEQQLLLLLDGLDEVRADRQSSCAAAINQFHKDYGPELVVCCRIKEYEALDQKLGFQSALYVRSLSDEQIWQYLDKAETGLTGLKSLLEKSSVRGDDHPQSEVLSREVPSLLELARSPLILNIMALTYQGVSANEILALNKGENYTHQLFSAYIDRMFNRRGLIERPVAYTPEQTLRWLHVLACQLTRASETVFLIERMQVSWLTSKAQRWVYVVMVWLSFLAIATVIGLNVMSPRSLPLALIVCGVIFARIFGLYRIVPAESLRWSWKKASRALLLGITVGPAVGWAIKLGFVSIFTGAWCVVDRACLQQQSILGLAFGLILGITYGVIRGLSGERIATVTKPNQGIRQSGKNAILFAVISSITPYFLARFLGNTSPPFWAASGLCFGLALGGGEACVKHGILRLILFCQGRTPWNYPEFLNYAAERIFLQKVGGGYIFIHRLLLEHFASLQMKR